MKKILSLLHVEPEEKKIVFYSFLFAFCIGIVLNFMYSVPLSMFLAKYSSTMLPYIYISSGIATFLVSLGFVYLEKHVSVFYFLSIPIVFLGVSLFLFWSLLVTTSASWIIGLLLIWSWVVALLLVGVFNVLFNQLFTLEQGKRLFGLMMGGNALGGIISGFNLDFLVYSIGPNQVILLAAFILFLALGIQFCIKKHSGTRLLHEENPDEPIQQPVSLKSLPNKKYIFSVFLLTALVYFMFYSFDLLLNTLVEKKYTNELEMASFFGILFAVYDVMTLVIGLFLSSWILHKFGVILSLTIMPGLLSISLLAAFFANLIPPLAFLVFPIVVAAAIMENMSREVIHAESTLLLLQPLRPFQRAWAQMKNEVSVQPLAMSIIGGILLIITHFFEIKVSNISLIVIGLGLTVIGVIFLVLKNGYVTLLSDALTKTAIINPSFTKLERDSLSLLKNHLKSPYPEEVIYVLETIKKLDQEEFNQALLESLDQSREEIRCYCLKQVEENRIKSIIEKVKQICLTETNAKILGCALLALGAIGGPENLSIIHSRLNDPNPEIASQCLLSLIKYGAPAEKEKALKILEEKLHSNDRKNYIEALKEIQFPEKIKLLLPLLKDSDYEVRLSACKGALNLTDNEIYHDLIDNLSIPQVAPAAFSTLLSMSHSVSEYIMSHFDRYSENVQIELIKLLGFIKNNQVKSFLSNLLNSSNRRLFYQTIQSLKKQSYKTENEEGKKSIYQYIARENDKILKFKEILENFSEEKTKAILSLIRREIELAQELCFIMLSFIYPEKTITKSMYGLLSDDEDAISYAEELLNGTLNEKDKKNFLAQLSFRSHTQIPNEKINIEEGLRKIISYAPDCYISSMLSAAVYTIGDLKLKNLTKIIQTFFDESDPFLNETLSWTKGKLAIQDSM